MKAQKVGEKSVEEEFRFVVANDDGRAVAPGGEGAFAFGEFDHAVLILERLRTEFYELRFTVKAFRRTMVHYGPTESEKAQGIAEWSVSTPWVEVGLLTACGEGPKTEEGRRRLARVCELDDPPTGLDAVLRRWKR